ncbi:MAG: glycosyltransferase [Acidobacteriota bacterium]
MLQSRQSSELRLSIIVIIHEMHREAPRTLHSLSPDYQQNVGIDDYEVIVIDNGSKTRLGPEFIANVGGNVQYFHLAEASPSPAYAINLGVSMARGQHLGIMIDGARMLTPGVLHHTLLALEGFDRAVVATLAFHLGPNLQNLSQKQGYDAAAEDELLASIDWPADGYRLFDIAALAGSSEYGWFLPMAESSCLFMPRSLFEELGGFEERFSSPAGGFANLDFYYRACQLPNSQLVMLIGEGSFHQIHGGLMTNCSAEDGQQTWKRFDDEYQQIRGTRFSWPDRQPMLLGNVSKPAIPWLEKSCQAYLHGTAIPRPST